MGKIGGLALVAVLGLTGCTSPARQAEVTPAAPTSNQRFLEVKTELLTMADAEDLTIETMGKNICNLYAKGKSEAEVTTLIIAASATLNIGDDGLKVGRSARANLCPLGSS